MKMRTIVLLVGTFLLIGVFALRTSFNNRNTSELLQQNQAVSQSSNIPTNEFDLNKIKIGDKIVGMTVRSILPYDESAKSLPLASNVKIQFKGQVTITGIYYYECPGFEGKCSEDKERLCFKDLDEVSQKKMPILKNGRNPIWFCFANVNEAKNLLTPNTGNKSVLIDNYTLNVYPSEVIDTADLIKVE